VGECCFCFCSVPCITCLGRQHAKKVNTGFIAAPRGTARHSQGTCPPVKHQTGTSIIPDKNSRYHHITLAPYAAPAPALFPSPEWRAPSGAPLSCRVSWVYSAAATACTALHCTALHCTALHCTALHCSPRNSKLYIEPKFVTALSIISAWRRAGQILFSQASQAKQTSNKQASKQTNKGLG
jgi:hypothetical protein